MSNSIQTSDIKCTTKIARGKKGIQTLTNQGRKEDYGGKQEVVADFCSIGTTSNNV